MESSEEDFTAELEDLEKDCSNGFGSSSKLLRMGGRRRFETPFFEFAAAEWAGGDDLVSASAL